MIRLVRLFSLIVPAALISGWVSAPRAAEVLSGPVAAEVVKVVDGDTLDVRVRIWLDQEILTKVRMDGIDTPESRSRCKAEKEMARRARGRLESLVTGAKDIVLLRDISHDKYGGRVRARVLLPDGTDLAAALIAEGHARKYDGGKRKPWCTGPTAEGTDSVDKPGELQLGKAAD
ncbi:thermonuclease family protein [Indioceanicola profundi]|uniref:thermonuclease family protein n=1 Tax=Indioceanicola profundi TaxID=2220096 RepID=UPI001CEC36CA|nr:thermonuclease family protein [Indioceanicola profundi]